MLVLNLSYLYLGHYDTKIVTGRLKNDQNKTNQIQDLVTCTKFWVLPYLILIQRFMQKKWVRDPHPLYKTILDYLNIFEKRLVVSKPKAGTQVWPCGAQLVLSFSWLGI